MIPRDSQQLLVGLLLSNHRQHNDLAFRSRASKIALWLSTAKAVASCRSMESQQQQKGFIRCVCMSMIVHIYVILCLCVFICVRVCGCMCGFMYMYCAYDSAEGGENPQYTEQSFLKLKGYMRFPHPSQCIMCV